MRERSYTLVASNTTNASRRFASTRIAPMPARSFPTRRRHGLGQASVSRKSLEMSMDNTDGGRVLIARPCPARRRAHGPLSTVRVNVVRRVDAVLEQTVL